MKSMVKEKLKDNMENITKNITIDRLKSIMKNQMEIGADHSGLKNKSAVTFKIILCSIAIAVMSTDAA